MDKGCNDQRVSFGKDKMTEHILIAGAGGQGIMLLGKIIAEAAMREDKFVTWFPSYGAEVRGGAAYCMVVVSDDEIGSPYVNKADTIIAMNRPSLDKFAGRLTNNGVLIVNSSLAGQTEGRKKNFFRFPFSDIAVKLGNIRVANMVALGVFIARKNIISAQTVIKTIKEIAPSDKKALVEINLKALKEGLNLK